MSSKKRVAFTPESVRRETTRRKNHVPSLVKECVSKSPKKWREVGTTA